MHKLPYTTFHAAEAGMLEAAVVMAGTMATIFSTGGAVAGLVYGVTEKR